MAEPVRIVGGNFDDKRNEGIQAQVSRNGSLHVREEGYQFSNFSRDSDYLYIGEVDAVGSWRISRYSQSSMDMKYAVGESSYSLNWTNKGSLTYSYYYNL